MIKVFITQQDVIQAAPWVQTGIAAAGSQGQTDATILLARTNVVKSLVTGGAVRLSLIAGHVQTVFVRLGTGALVPVFPTPSTQIEAAALNAEQSIQDGSQATFTFDGVDTWLIS